MTASSVVDRPATHLAASLRVVWDGQHANGEILSYRRDADRNYAYCRTPFVSAFVHESLRCFDWSSPGWLDGATSLVPAPAVSWFEESARAVRHRIRNFILWQQEPDGCWRFFGRGSAIDPDVNTTVLASLALHDNHGSHSVARWERQQEAVWAFQSPDGPFHTFVRPGRGGYGWLDEHGYPMAGFDRVVNADVLRYLGRLRLLGLARARPLVEWLLAETDRDLSVGTTLYPNPLSFIYALGRAYAESALPEAARFAERLLPALLALQRRAGDFGGPLSTAMGATALLDLGHAGTELERARSALLGQMLASGGWTYEDLVVHGFGSPASTTAAALAFLARHHCTAGGRP